MEFRDFTDPDRFVATAFKAMCIIFALALIPNLLLAIFSQLSLLEMLIGVLFFLLLSPAAYLVWRARQDRPERRERRERRGAERTPVLPVSEDDYE